MHIYVDFSYLPGSLNFRNSVVCIQDNGAFWIPIALNVHPNVCVKTLMLQLDHPNG